MSARILLSVALSAGFAALAASEEEWAKAGDEAALALLFQSTPLDLPLDAENALRDIGALAEDQDGA